MSLLSVMATVRKAMNSNNWFNQRMPYTINNSIFYVNIFSTHEKSFLRWFYYTIFLDNEINFSKKSETRVSNGCKWRHSFTEEYKRKLNEIKTREKKWKLWSFVRRVVKINFKIAFKWFILFISIVYDSMLTYWHTCIPMVKIKYFRKLCKC